MAKKQDKKEVKFKCDTCKFFTDKCEHSSNQLIILKKRIETLTYKSLDKKAKCEFYQCLEQD